ncbi:septum formation initiator family protein [Tamlana agarivorans]|uniref:Septum formation initiator family protein n=1 Tax=Pseudotamlana agarivorans TaxID=481183 RepID=A0ACC5U4Z9_9FLAO|nr:septum formation initiator family protein [Tamlana agarivorans]MBU2949389.1 septum formation initiator family protein [Tamlana agarivorans]
MKFKKNKYLKPFKNIFLPIGAGFIVWMLFFDANSWIIHSELNGEIDALENEKEYYRKEILKDKKDLKKLETNDGLEKFAREKYYMKYPDEEIYIIEYEDSLKTDVND